MQKLLHCIVISTILLVSCTNSPENSPGNPPSPEKKDKKISSRNYSITTSNAYSDLFLDSSLVEKFVMEKNIPDSIAWRIRSFYNSRNFEFAWFSGDGLTEQARGFWNLHNYYTSSTADTTLDNKGLKKRMDKLIAEDTIFPSARNTSIISTEILLTGQFIKHTLLSYQPDYVKRKEMERFVPSKKQDALYLADSLLKKKHKDDKYYEDVNPAYGLLKDQLAKYYIIQTDGGWPTILSKKKIYKKGMSAPEIVVMKKRLFLSGDLAQADSTQVFDEALEKSVKKFQRFHGLEATGVVGGTTLKEMNIPVLYRIRQLLINMDRMRWLPIQPEGDLIIVNIPAFTLSVLEGNKKIFDMDVVVGKEGHNTRIFTGNLNQVVFSPYWNVPQSIVEKEILPAIKKNPDYLEKENMEITGENDSLPEIRQRPGEKNALGKVKFIFPNSFDIYFHDTPSKSLFAKNKRAFSHGCIRLSDPVRMTKYLLRDQPEWNDAKIEDAMNNDKEKIVTIKKPVPVLITYYTAWVDEQGNLNFREDIYGHDAELSTKMFSNPL